MGIAARPRWLGLRYVPGSRRRGFRSAQLGFSFEKEAFVRLQRATGGWAAALLLLTTGVRLVSAAVPPSDGDAPFEWKQGWVESPQWGGRLGYINGQGDLKVRLRSGPADSWVTVARQVRSFQLLDWSLAVLGNDRTLFAAEGALHAPLEAVAENVCG